MIIKIIANSTIGTQAIKKAVLENLKIPKHVKIQRSILGIKDGVSCVDPFTYEIKIAGRLQAAVSPDDIKYKLRQTMDINGAVENTDYIIVDA